MKHAPPPPACRRVRADPPLPTFIAALRAHARGAKLIWASTTGLKPAGPVPATDPTAPRDPAAADKGKVMMNEDMAPASNARIDRRNAIAAAYMQLQGIPIDDLHGVVQGHPEYYSGAVHFNATGIAAQADHVAAALRALLP